MKVTYIAEIGNNHNGSLTLAKQMVDAAVLARATWIKFQIYNLNKFIDPENIFYGDFKAEQLSFEHFRTLKTYVEKQGGKFLATPFDEDSLMLLEELNVEAIKIASGDMTNWPLLKRVVAMKTPIFISSGGATLEEIDQTVSFLKSNGADFQLLHCVLEYPSPFESLNLKLIPFLASRYSIPVGYSDHSLGIEASLAAVALGASTIEKHFTINRDLPGGDNSMSILPEELARLIREGQHISIALGTGHKMLTEGEKKVKGIVRRVFYVAMDTGKGEVLSDRHLLLLRGKNELQGLSTDQYSLLIGKKLKRDVHQGELVSLEMFE